MPRDTAEHLEASLEAPTILQRVGPEGMKLLRTSRPVVWILQPFE